MKEEIFGPLLPIITVSGVDEAIQFINDREKPLVVYVFSHDNKVNTSPANMFVSHYFSQHWDIYVAVILKCSDVDEVVPTVLCLIVSPWLVLSNKQLIKRVIAETSSGALLANDCLVHFTVSALPFGGVGECQTIIFIWRNEADTYLKLTYFPTSCSGNSGMGCYHGRHSFDQLSHLRSCLIKQLKMEGVNSMRYPPHTAKKLGWARFFLLKQINVCRLRRMALLTVLVSLAAFVVQVKRLKYTNPV